MGVHGLNTPDWQAIDFDALARMKAESVKLMSFALAETGQRIKTLLPDCAITVRLWDGGFGKGGKRLAPATFAQVSREHIDRLSLYATRFEIHNEPNHMQGIEGWGQEDDQAKSFNQWFVEVYDRLKGWYPHLQFGFPGLAPHHNDERWLEICQEAIEKADWVGVHCYWQNPTTSDRNHLSDYFGLWFKHYLDHIPSNKPIEITECGNSNCQNGYVVDWQRIGQEYVAWLGEVFEHPRIEATHGFILSAPQDEWQGFAWVDKTGNIRPVVSIVGDMARPSLYGEEPVPAPPPIVPEPEPEPAPVPRPNEGELAFVGAAPGIVFAGPNLYFNVAQTITGSYSPVEQMVSLLSAVPLRIEGVEYPDNVEFLISSGSGGALYIARISGPLAWEFWVRLRYGG